jgi:hypothetical protein
MPPYDNNQNNMSMPNLYQFMSNNVGQNNGYNNVGYNGLSSSANVANSAGSQGARTSISQDNSNMSIADFLQSLQAQASPFTTYGNFMNGIGSLGQGIAAILSARAQNKYNKKMANLYESELNRNNQRLAQAQANYDNVYK